MRGIHFGGGGWAFMVHGAASVGFDDQLGNLGGTEFMSTNWIMGMAEHGLWGGQAQLRGMLSLEPLTVPAGGLPALLQTGEYYNRVHIHDRPHHHEPSMAA